MKEQFDGYAPLLSILIPTVVGREPEYEVLLSKLRVEMFGYPYVNIHWRKDNKEMTIGEKRELLYKDARGLFSLMIDDDDEIAHDSIETILNAIKSNPEIPCITFREKCIINGQYFSSNHSIKYSDWGEKQDGFDYVRTPFYKDVIRTDIAKSVPFEHIRFGEDHAWSRAIKPLLTDEIHIDEEIYHYIHNSTDHNERYGFNKNI